MGSYAEDAFELTGFGLSVPTPGYGFLPDEHARVVGGSWRPSAFRRSLRSFKIGAARSSHTLWRSTRDASVNGDVHFELFSRTLGGAFRDWWP